MIFCLHFRILSHKIQKYETSCNKHFVYILSKYHKNIPISRRKAHKHGPVSCFATWGIPDLAGDGATRGPICRGEMTPVGGTGPQDRKPPNKPCTMRPNAKQLEKPSHATLVHDDLFFCKLPLLRTDDVEIRDWIGACHEPLGCDQLSCRRTPFRREIKLSMDILICFKMVTAVHKLTVMGFAENFTKHYISNWNQKRNSLNPAIDSEWQACALTFRDWDENNHFFTGNFFLQKYCVKIPEFTDATLRSCAMMDTPGIKQGLYRHLKWKYLFRGSCSLTRKKWSNWRGTHDPPFC